MRKAFTFLISIVVLAALMLGGYAIYNTSSQKSAEDERLAELEQQNRAESLESKKGEPSEGSLPEKGDGKVRFTAIGDSVMLGALPALEELFPDCVIDAAESRQVWNCLELLQQLDAQGKLDTVVIIALGTNSPFNISTGQEVLDYLGDGRTVYWVTSYGMGWQEEVNAAIQKLADQNKNVHLMDWAGTASKHPDWFYDDGIHLNPDGQEGYANFILDSLPQP